MSETTLRKWYLFVYTVEGRSGFWTYAGERYGRFVTLGEQARLMRIQDELPAGAYGFTTMFDERVAGRLVQAAGQAGLHLAFYDNPLDCDRAASAELHGQWVFDLGRPAGRIEIGGQ